MLLDLSAAFDTVDHEKLLKILKYDIGVRDTALQWFRSFLIDRSQKVKLGLNESDEIEIKYGVPQGSVLGPVLFNLYIGSLYNTAHAMQFTIHGFADDHQVYKSFHHQQQHTIMAIEVPACFEIINNWMTSHYLQLNPGKTEIIIFGSPSTLEKVEIKGVFLEHGICIRTISVVKQLGFRLDESLSFKQQVTVVKKVCFMMLRNIAKMKPFLTPQQIQTLVQALVISHLDYCNGLYYGINSHLLRQLQTIQNRACRVILGLKKRDSVDEHLQSLHWLKVNERIEFKILLIVFKSLIGKAPTYIDKLITYDSSSGSRTLSLKIPPVQSNIGSRSFSVCGPSLWNQLPQSVKCCCDLNMFKQQLKSYLFKRCYKL